MKPFIRILHLEDDPNDVALVQAGLEEAGLTCRFTTLQTREEFEEALRRDAYDIVLSDYRLPAYDGMSALRLTLEVCPDVPFIFVSGTMGEEAAIEGLKHGATDYVLKQNLIRIAPAVERALREAEHRREHRHRRGPPQSKNGNSGTEPPDAPLVSNRRSESSSHLFSRA